jgi:hypothetical protein
MKKILILGSFLLLPLFIFANVNFTLSSNKVAKGERVSFSIEATGNSITFPQIEKIGPYPVYITADRDEIVYSNNSITTKKVREYSFKPEKNITIPELKIVVDGKEYRTKPAKIIVDKQAGAKIHEPVKLEIISNKKELFVGEPVVVTIKLIVNANSKIAKAQLEQPEFPNFWIKWLNNGTQRQVGNTIIQEYKLLAFPQKSGKLTIGPVRAQVAKAQKIGRGFGFDDDFFNDFFQTFNWSSIKSNSLTLDVKPLPNNLELYGDFSISASVDKTKVQANKPVNLTIKVKGFGNIDDIKKFELNIPEAVVYSDEPKIKSYIQNGKYGGEFSQKVAIVADRNYTIPSITLEYFSAKEQKVKTIQTKPIAIEVIGGNKAAPAQIITSTPSQAIATPLKEKVVIKEKLAPLNYLWLVLSFLAGGAVVFSFFAFKNRKKEKKELEITKAIKKAKDDKELFKVLLPYQKEHPFIAKVLEKLEANIYKNAKNSINKKELIEYFEDRDVE